MESQKTRTINVNVIEFPDKTEPYNIHITSFTDNDEGNVEAERLMFQLAKENGYDGKCIDEFLEEEGDVYENGDYMVLITHS